MNFVTAECPWCSTKHPLSVETTKMAGHDIIYCEDVEASGCGKYFAIFWEVSLKAQSWKIEGQ